MLKLCTICQKEFSTVLKIDGRTIYSLDRINCLECSPFRRHSDISDPQRRFRNRRLKYYYNIDLEEYERLLKEQNNQCAICLTDPPQSHKKHLSVDHDHTTGKVRGLLCTKCNIMLGWLEKHKNPILDYLDIYQSQEVQ